MADESFASHLPALTGSVLGTVLSGVAGSYLGIGGTVLGLVVGSAIFGVAAWFTERWVRGLNALAKAKAEAVRQRGGRPLTEHETQIITAITAEKQRRRRQFRWKPVAWLAGMTAVVSLAVVVTWSLAAGHTAILRAPAPDPTSHPATVTVSPSQPRTASPSVSPSPASASPSVSPSVSSPVSTPDASPDASPDISPSLSPSDTSPQSPAITGG